MDIHSMSIQCPANHIYPRLPSCKNANGRPDKGNGKCTWTIQIAV